MQRLCFPLEEFNPRPCFSAAREGLGKKKKPSSIDISLRIENLIFQRCFSKIKFVCHHLCLHSAPAELSKNLFSGQSQ